MAPVMEFNAVEMAQHSCDKDKVECGVMFRAQ